MLRQGDVVTKRETVLQLIKVAGYHADYRSATRLLVENPVSRKNYNLAWEAGVAAKRSGVPCNCYLCNRGAK
jgi:hypothetical protein